ncbi:hypothetical protein COLO4_33497 [Corchorus olitorius]|uniref:Fibronectin type III-like domain-containing protein n=1 Tax=Corchorus olitorius TaxID=93759 RepID=A0A1R3GT85_9ROSI|nr:hypothetical protein COLO4_33497 [Corchorus olitorius]
MAPHKTLFVVLLSSILLSLVSSSPVSSGEDSIPKYVYVCDASRYKHLGLDMANFAFCDKSLPYEVRAKDLVDSMTLIEKAEQMGDNTSLGIPRLGLPRYRWWSEALHGISDFGQSLKFDSVVPNATSFPTVILSAATFNQTLWKTLGQVVSTEARAMYNLGRSGLTFWSPNINVVRDPRWGRTLETPGEDPFLAGTYAVNYVRGLQDIEGDNSTDLNSRPLKVSACCKHLTAYDIDNYQGVSRTSYNAKTMEQDMVETFNKPFEMCVKEGDVSSVMYIVSDCDSIHEIVHSHHWLDDTLKDASAQVLQAGMDLDCGVSYLSLPNSVKQGKVKESDIDQALKNLYIVLMRLGYFDGIPSLASLDKNNICPEEHIELAAEAARQGIVLLKNEKQTLPLDPSKFQHLALIGIPCQYSSPLDAFSAFGQVTYEIGCGDVKCKNDSLIFRATKAAKNADATLLFVGLNLDVEAESLDRNDLLLPGYQTQLIKAVAEASKGPVILVIMSAGEVDVSFAKHNPKINSILWVGYPGQEGGRAIADVVFGKYNPGGRLPLTWYGYDYIQKLPMTSMTFRPVDNGDEVYPGRTYRFYNGSTVYPFGYGLSYTNFKYEANPKEISLDIKLNRFQHCHELTLKNETKTDQPCPSVSVDDLTCDDQVAFEVDVHNVGERDGNDVVLVYTVAPKEIDGTPIKQLVGFERVFVAAKGSKKVKFALNACKSFNIVNFSGYKLLPSGLHRIVIGDNAISIPVQVSYKR